MRRVCCECGKVMDKGNGPDDVTSHGLCEVCYIVAMADIENYKATRAKRMAALSPKIKLTNLPKKEVQ